MLHPVYFIHFIIIYIHCAIMLYLFQLLIRDANQGILKKIWIERSTYIRTDNILVFRFSICYFLKLDHLREITECRPSRQVGGNVRHYDTRLAILRRVR